VKALRHTLRWRYQLVEICTLPLWRDGDLDRLSQRERPVSKHWFRFSASQARESAIEWARTRGVPNVTYIIVPIG